MSTEQVKPNKVHLHVLIEQSQQDKLRLVSYYSGKSYGEIIRIAIDSLQPLPKRKNVSSDGEVYFDEEGKKV